MDSGGPSSGCTSRIACSGGLFLACICCTLCSISSTLSAAVWTPLQAAWTRLAATPPARLWRDSTRARAWRLPAESRQTRTCWRSDLETWCRTWTPADTGSAPTEWRLRPRGGWIRRAWWMLLIAADLFLPDLCCSSCFWPSNTSDLFLLFRHPPSPPTPRSSWPAFKAVQLSRAPNPNLLSRSRVDRRVERRAGRRAPHFLAFSFFLPVSFLLCSAGKKRDARPFRPNGQELRKRQNVNTLSPKTAVRERGWRVYVAAQTAAHFLRHSGQALQAFSAAVFCLQCCQRRP